MVVRSTTPETARALREELPDLVKNLKDQGFDSNLDGERRQGDGRPKKQYERTDDDD